MTMRNKTTHYTLPILATLTLLAAPTISHAKAAIEGLWLTENKRAAINIKPCANSTKKLCGYIHWIIEGGMTHDTNNPDKNLQTKPMCGLEILKNFEQKADRYWDNGTIYKADEGDTYDAYLQSKENGTLKLRGFLGVSLFGKSQIWTRTDNKSHPKCTPAL